MNPYEPVDGQISITSLTLSDAVSNDVLQFHPQQHEIEVDIGIPVASTRAEGGRVIQEARNITYVISSDEIMISRLDGLLEPMDGAWNSSAYHIVVDVEEGFQGMLYAQLALDEMPPSASDDRPFLKRTFQETSKESERTTLFQAR